MELAAVKDADQLLTNGLLVGFAPATERNCRHGLTPNAARRRQSRQHRGVVAYRYILGRAGSACHASGMIVCCHRRSERSAAMKTSLAIVLAVAALISGATVSLNPGTASA